MVAENFLDLHCSLFFNKASDFYRAIRSEINSFSNTTKILLQNLRASFNFRFSLKTVIINWTKILELSI